jgi:hypothetical protein
MPVVDRLEVRVLLEASPREVPLASQLALELLSPGYDLLEIHPTSRACR